MRSRIAEQQIEANHPYRNYDVERNTPRNRRSTEEEARLKRALDTFDRIIENRKLGEDLW